MHENIKFIKKKTVLNKFEIEPKRFSRIFVLDLIVLILEECVIIGDKKVDLVVKHASRWKDTVIFTCEKAVYIFDFKKRVVYKLEVDETMGILKGEYDGNVLEVLFVDGVYKSYRIGDEIESKEVEIKEESKIVNFWRGGHLKTNDDREKAKLEDVLSTELGDIFIYQDKIEFNKKEAENELYYGEDANKPCYYASSFGKYLLLGSSNNSNVYLYDSNLEIIEMEGKDFVYVQADEDDNQLYFRGMDCHENRLVVVDLKGSIIEYEIESKDLEGSTEEQSLFRSFVSKSVKVENNKFIVEDCELEEVESISKEEEKFKSRLEKPLLTFTKELEEGNEKESSSIFDKTVASFISNGNTKANTSIFASKSDTSFSSKIISTQAKDMSFSQLDKSLLSSEELKDDKAFTNEEISFLSGGREQNKNLEIAESKPASSIFSLKDSEQKTPKKDIPEEVLKTRFGSLKEDTLNKTSIFSFKQTEDKSKIESSSFKAPTETKDDFPKFSQQLGVKSETKDDFPKFSQQLGGKAETKDDFSQQLGKGSQSSTLQSPNPFGNKQKDLRTPSVKSKPSLDTVENIVSSILSIKTNTVSINNYKVNSTTDRIEKQLYLTKTKLKKIEDIKKKMESDLLNMIYTLDTLKSLDSKSVEDSMRYFDEVIERKTKFKTPVIYNSPILEPSLKKTSRLETTLEEEMSKLNLNVLTKIKLEPVYSIERINLIYKEKEVKKEEIKDVMKEVIKPKAVEQNPKDIPQNTQPFPPSNPFNPQATSTTPPCTPTNPFNSNPQNSNSSDIFNRVLGSSIPVIPKEEKKEDNKPQVLSLDLQAATIYSNKLVCCLNCL